VLARHNSQSRASLNSSDTGSITSFEPMITCSDFFTFSAWLLR